jgi:hypothetical protein
MNLIQSGAPGNATIEECIGDLIQALDAICELAGVARQNLMKMLSLSNADAIKKIRQAANSQIQLLRSRNLKQGEVSALPVIDRISGRLSNVANEERDFGLAVSDLLKTYQLQDAQVMNGYYAALPSPSVTWEGLLAAVRTAVLHKGSLGPLDSAKRRMWFSFLRHLHDICKRVILSEIGYDGTYAATNAAHRGTYRVDRITAKTSVLQLGYSSPPHGV